MTDCEDHDWEHVETSACSRYVPDGILKRYKCSECGVTKEDVYTLQKRVVDGAEVSYDD